jgi:hypothetical protein
VKPVTADTFVLADARRLRLRPIVAGDRDGLASTALK